MYDKLPLDYIGITDYFKNRIDPISGEDKMHYAVDLGWHIKAGEAIYAASDATVTLEAFDATLGNYIVLSYEKDDKTIINRYCHMRDRSLVKKDAKVRRGQVLGYMGATGYAVGVHLHFEYWICPKGYKYNYIDKVKYAVNPLDYCYLFENQQASTKSLPNLKKVVGKKVLKDENKSQLEVVKKGLNCREEPSLSAKVLGYIDYGYYDVLDIKANDNYTWYKIANNRWLADVDNSFNLYLNKALNPNCIEKDIEIEELKEQVLNQKKIIEDLIANDLKDLDNFVAPKDDYYYILLKNGETIYYPKN